MRDLTLPIEPIQGEHLTRSKCEINRLHITGSISVHTPVYVKMREDSRVRHKGVEAVTVFITIE